MYYGGTFGLLFLYSHIFKNSYLIIYVILNSLLQPTTLLQHLGYYLHSSTRSTKQNGRSVCTDLILQVTMTLTPLGHMTNYGFISIFISPITTELDRME